MKKDVNTSNRCCGIHDCCKLMMMIVASTPSDSMAFIGVVWMRMSALRASNMRMLSQVLCSVSSLLIRRLMWRSLPDGYTSTPRC